MGATRLVYPRQRPPLKLYTPLPDPAPDLGQLVWVIDHKIPVAIVLYSERQFAGLQDPPADARQFPGGVWGRLALP